MAECERCAILEQYLNEDLLTRLAVEHGWPHEPNNPLGRWCCSEHETAHRNGTLYPKLCGRAYQGLRCTLPAGHNRGKADIPKNHKFD